MFIIGRKPVLEAIRSGARIAKIYCRFGVHGDSIAAVVHAARGKKIPVVELPKQKFDRLGFSGEVSQGVAALVEEIAEIAWQDLLLPRADQDPPFLVACDELTDPHNLGAILRSAECSGAHGVLLPKRGSAMITDTVVKSSAGATAHVPIARTDNLGRTLDEVKETGVWLVGLDERGDQDLFHFDGTLPLCLVVGSEGSGLRPVIRKRCDIMIRIPMWGQVASLNASVAAALAMYEVRRKRVLVPGEDDLATRPRKR